MPFESITLPYIFLAFANPRDDLHRLANEHSSIRMSLEKAEKAGLCKFIERFNLNISTLINVFQDSKLANRISIFHFGGHAGDFELILNNSEVEGHFFNKFLLEIQSLRLVFLNGCSTFQQGQDLLNLGIPAVIVTSQKIPDDVAEEFASRFYNGIAEGLSINDSFEQAKSAILSSSANNIKISQTLSDPRKPKRDPDILWSLYCSNEDASNWKLSDEINNPYFGLPKPLNYSLPQTPYISLQPYTEKESLIFWGRGNEIKDLFIRVMDKNANPIILLYGQTGVGKSSLLDAGLVPRLKAVSNVFYARRSPDIGLINTLAKSLDIHSDKSVDFIYAFKKLMKSTEKGIIIIIDQLEEVFTKPIKEFHSEIKDLFFLLSEITKSKDLNNIKIILGYRKEYHAEIESESIKIKIPFFAYFLHPLNRDNLIEIINGSNLSVTTRNQYCINIEKGLDEQIADDLSKDIDSPIAPILQILLTKLWEKSTFTNNTRLFSKKTYYDLKDNGLALGDFITQKIIEISEWNIDVVESGLLLDILYFHTTPLGTSASNKLKLIIERYNSTLIEEIIQKCKDLYLLSENKESGEYICLAHDTLAPIIRAMFESSLKNGQKANRIFINQETYLLDESEITPLNSKDLETVEKGANGMRKLNDRELKLIEKSQKERGRTIRQKKILKIILGITAMGISLLSFISFISWHQYKDQAKFASAQNKAAQSRFLANEPFQFLSAAQLALDGLNQYKSLETNLQARYILNKMLSPISTFSYPDSIYGIEKMVFSNDNNYFATSSGVHIKIFNVKTRKLLKDYFINDRDKGRMAYSAEDLRFSKNDRFLGYAYLGKIWIWEWKTNKKPIVINATNFSAFNSKGNYVACASNFIGMSVKKMLLKDGIIQSIKDSIEYRTGALHIYKTDEYLSNEELQKYQQYFNYSLCVYNTSTGIKKYTFKRDEVITDVEFSPRDSLLCAVGYTDGDVILYRLKETKPLFTFHSKSSVTDIEFDSTGDEIIVAHDNGLIEVLNINSKKIKTRCKLNNYVTEVHFSKNGTSFISQSNDNTTRVWNTKTGVEVFRHDFDNYPSGVAFLKNGKYFASCSSNDNVRLFNSSTGKEYGVVPIDLRVKSICASPDENYLATLDFEGKAIIWSTTISDQFSILNNRLIKGNKMNTIILTTPENIILKKRTDPKYRLSINHYGKNCYKYLFDQKGNLVTINLNLDSDGVINKSQIIPPQIPYEELVPIVYLNYYDSLLGSKKKPKAIKRKVTFYKNLEPLNTNRKKMWERLFVQPHPIVAITKNEKILATASMDIIWIWDLENKKLLSRISQGYEVSQDFVGNDEIKNFRYGEISNLFFTSDGKVLCTRTKDRVWRCWNVKNPNKPKLLSIKRLNLNTYAKKDILLPFIATRSYSGLNKLYILSLPSLSKRDSLISKEELKNFYFNAKGDKCALVSAKTNLSLEANPLQNNNFIEVWDLNTHEKLSQFILNGDINDIVFSSDNKNIAITQQNTLIRIWDLETNKEVSRIALKPFIKSVFFADNDRIIVSIINSADRIITDHYSNEILLSYWKQEDLSKLLTERINSVRKKKQ